MQPPKRLKNDARKKWLEIFSDFSPANAMDTEAACQYCEAWSDYIQSRKDVARMGTILTCGKNGAPYQNPAIGTGNKCLDQMRRLYERLTPLMKAPKEKDFSDV